MSAPREQVKPAPESEPAQSACHTDVHDPAAAIASLREDLRTAASRFRALMTELESVAVELADLEARLYAARHQAGDYRPMPPARELAAEVLHHAVRAFTPYVPLVSHEAAERAETMLMNRQ